MSNSLTIPQARRELAEADHELKGAITRFSGYQDPAGNNSTGPKGIAIQINRRIKLHYGQADDFDADTCLAVAALRMGLARVLDKAQEDHLMRDEVKKTIYRHIERSAEEFRASQVRLAEIEVAA